MNALTYPNTILEGISISEREPKQAVTRLIGLLVILTLAGYVLSSCS